MSILNGEKSTRNAIGSIILFEYRTSTEIGIFTVQNRTSKYRVHISRIQVEINKNITISNKKKPNLIRWTGQRQTNFQFIVIRCRRRHRPKCDTNKQPAPIDLVTKKCRSWMSRALGKCWMYRMYTIYTTQKNVTETRYYQWVNLSLGAQIEMCHFSLSVVAFSLR